MASVLMKLVFAQILTRYDIVLAGGSDSSHVSSARVPLAGSLSFEEFYVPDFGKEISLRRREK